MAQDQAAIPTCNPQNHLHAGERDVAPTEKDENKSNPNSASLTYSISGFQFL